VIVGIRVGKMSVPNLESTNITESCRDSRVESSVSTYQLSTVSFPVMSREPAEDNRRGGAVTLPSGRVVYRVDYTVNYLWQRVVCSRVMTCI